MNSLFDSKELTYSEYLHLCEEINSYNHAYYHNGQSPISDGEYDQRFQLLKDQERKHPEWITPHSPTQRLISQWTIQDGFRKAKHKIPLLSLDNTYNNEDLIDRDKSTKRTLEKRSKTLQWWYSIEPKFDGISIELVYSQWSLQSAITRWDWYQWEDVTANAKTIHGIPHHIPYQWEIHIRWEIVMPKSSFEILNATRSKNWEPLFANPRNAAAGSVKQLDTSITASRGLVCYVYEILSIE